MVCSWENCGGKEWAAGLCSRHYERKRRTGTCEDGPRARRPFEERLWSKIDKRGPDECWPWVSKNLNEGYGTIGLPGRGSGMMLAHRAVWTVVNGPIPEGPGHHGHVVMHTCDNRLCCNPAHLRLGTQGENVKDMDAKKRRVNAPRQGEKHHKAKLTDDQVRFIRSSKESNRALGRQFGVSHAMIGYIKRGANWRHIA